MVCGFYRIALGIALAGMASLAMASATARAAARCDQEFEDVLKAGNARVRALKPGEAFRGEVQLKNGDYAYVEFRKGDPRKPTLVITNGFINDIDKFEPFLSILDRNRPSILTYYHIGQGETAAAMRRAGRPIVPESGITQAAYVEQFNDVLDAVGVRSKVHVLGYSYGSFAGSGVPPSRMRSLTLLSPFVRSFSESTVAMSQANAMGNLMSLNPFLAPMVESTKRAQIRRVVQEWKPRIPEGVPETEYLDALEEQALAIEGFDLRKADFSGIPEVHFVLGGNEHAFLKADQISTWNAIPEASRSSALVIEGSGHKSLEDAVGVVGVWINNVLGLGGKNRLRGIYSIKADGTDVRKHERLEDAFESK